MVKVISLQTLLTKLLTRITQPSYIFYSPSFIKTGSITWSETIYWSEWVHVYGLASNNIQLSHRYMEYGN